MAIEIPKDHAERLKCFVYHSNIPLVSQTEMETVRQRYIDLAADLCDAIPECRSKSLALTYLEESLMRAIQALALTGIPDCLEV